MKVKDKYDLLPLEKQEMEIVIRADGRTSLYTRFYKTDKGNWGCVIPLSYEILVNCVGELEVDDDE